MKTEYLVYLKICVLLLISIITIGYFAKKYAETSQSPIMVLVMIGILLVWAGMFRKETKKLLLLIIEDLRRPGMDDTSEESS